MTTAVKITLAGGDVDFYEDEIRDIKVAYLTSFDALVNQTISPIGHIDSDEWIVVQIEFYEYFSTTLAKIQSVINEKAEMVLYYAYAYSPATSINCIHDNDGTLRTWNYIAGDSAAQITHRCTFLESSK